VYKIAVIAGDSTRPGLIAEALKVLKAAEDKYRFKVDLTTFVLVLKDIKERAKLCRIVPSKNFTSSTQSCSGQLAIRTCSLSYFFGQSALKALALLEISARFFTFSFFSPFRDGLRHFVAPANLHLVRLQLLPIWGKSERLIFQLDYPTLKVYNNIVLS